TSDDDVPQHSLHALQVGALRTHLGEMSRSQIPRLGTGLVTLIGETQERADLVEAEAQFARPQDEAKPPLMMGVVATIAGGRARRRGQQTDLLVIAHGFEIAACPPSELGSLKALHTGNGRHCELPLDSVLPTDFKVPCNKDFSKE